MTGPLSQVTAQDPDLESDSLCPYSYFSTIDAFLSASEDTQSSSLESQQGAPSCSCTTQNRYLSLCIDGTLLEMDLETACVVAQLNIGENLVSMSYLHNRFKNVVGLTESGYLKQFDLLRGRVATLAFALKKNQSLEDDSTNSSVKFAASSVTPGIFWSIGKSHSVYWLSLKRSSEVLEKKHLPTIEDAFRIKSNVKSPIVAMTSFEKAPLLVIGRAGGSLEIYNTSTFKLLHQVQLNMQKMVDMEAKQLSGNTFSVCCLGCRGTGAYSVHQLECIFPEGSYSNITKIHPRDPLCSVSSHLVGERPKMVHLQKEKVAVVNQDTNSITQVSLGHHSTHAGGNVTRIEALNIVKRDSLPDFGNVEEPSCLCLFGLNPHLETIFVCRKVREERMMHLQLDIFQSLARLKEDCGRNHNTCIGYDMKQNESSLGELRDDPLALSVMHLQSRTDKIEKFSVMFKAASNCFRITLTEFSMSQSASKTSFFTEHAMPEEFKVDSIHVQHVYNRRFAETEEGDCTCWLLQCSHNLLFLVWKQSHASNLGVEHFFGKACRFIEHNDDSVKKVAYFCLMKTNKMEVYEKDLMIEFDSAPSSCLSNFSLGGMTKTLQLLNCEFTSDPRNWSFLNCVWSSDGGVFVGIADKSTGKMDVQFNWHLETEQELILDQAFIDLAKVKDSDQQFNVALLTNRRVLILNEALSVAKEFPMQENDGQVISIHWLQESNRLVCMTRSKVLELTNWAGFGFSSTLSLDMSSPSTGCLDSSCEPFKGVAFLGKRDILYFNRQMHGIQDTDILSYTLSGRSIQKKSADATGYKDRLVDELIKKLDPGIEVSDSQINVSIRGLKLYCHAKANVNRQKEVVAKWLELLMTNPSRVDLRYNNNPLVRVCEEEVHALRVILNLVARKEDPSFAQQLFTKSTKAVDDSVDRVVDEEVELEFSGIPQSYGLISTLVENPFLFDSPAPAENNNQNRRELDQQPSETQGQDAFSTGTATPSPSISLLDSHKATPNATDPIQQVTAVVAEQAEPEIATTSLGAQHSNTHWSSDSEDSSDEEGTSSFFGQPKKKFMISIKPKGDSTPVSKGEGSSLQLKSAIAGLSLESPPLMSLETPQQEQKGRTEIGSPPLMDLQSPPVMMEKQEGPTESSLTVEMSGTGTELSLEKVKEEEKERDANPVKGSFDSSSDDSDDDEDSFRKRINIKIKPASHSSGQSSTTASTSDIRNMLSSLRSSIEGPLLKEAAPQKAPSEPAISETSERNTTSVSSNKTPLPTTSANQAQDDSAVDFQDGLKLLNVKRWKEAITKFDTALGKMSKEIDKLKKYWLVVVHHRVYAALMQECESLRQDHEQDCRVHRNLMLCARRLRLQSLVGVQVSIFAAQSLMRTEEYQKAYLLLDAMLKVLPRYGAKMAQMTPKVAQMKQLCQAKIEVSAEIEEKSFLGAVAEHLHTVQSTEALEQISQQLIQVAREI